MGRVKKSYLLNVNYNNPNFVLATIITDVIEIPKIIMPKVPNSGITIDSPDLTKALMVTGFVPLFIKVPLSGSNMMLAPEFKVVAAVPLFVVKDTRIGP